MPGERLGLGSQSALTDEAKCAIGLASIPVASNPAFFASTTVVPVPQNGSSTVAPGARAILSSASRTRCGGKARTKRYQRCTARSSGRRSFSVAPRRAVWEGTSLV